MPEKVKLKTIKVQVTEETHKKYHAACEKVYCSKKSGDIPIRQFILGFINENSKPPKIK